MNRLTSFIFAAMLVIIFIAVTKCTKQTVSLNQAKDTIKEKTDVVKSTKLENGLLRADKSALITDRRNLVESYQKENESLRDDLKLSKRQAKNLKSLLKSNIVTSGSGEVILKDTTIYDTDTVRVAKTVDIKEDWFEFKGTWTNNTFRYNYTYKDSLTFATYYDRKARSTKVSAISYNPKTEIKGMTSIIIAAPRKKRFHLGVGVAYFPNQTLVGVTFSYSLISF